MIDVRDLIEVELLESSEAGADLLVVSAAERDGVATASAIEIQPGALVVELDPDTPTIAVRGRGQTSHTFGGTSAITVQRLAQEDLAPDSERGVTEAKCGLAVNSDP